MDNRVLISADCVCDIPMRMAEEMNISLMYYYIITEEGKFRDKTEVRTEQILEYMEIDGKKAHSAAAKVEDYREYFAGLRKKSNAPIVHICMSRKLSRGCGRAEEAARSFQDIYVVDSKTISGGMGHLVFQAAEMANAGACVEMILTMLEKDAYQKQEGEDFEWDYTWFQANVETNTMIALFQQKHRDLYEKVIHIGCESLLQIAGGRTIEILQELLADPDPEFLRIFRIHLLEYCHHLDDLATGTAVAKNRFYCAKYTED